MHSTTPLWSHILKNLLIVLVAASLFGCGDDAKTASSNNAASNNTTSNNTATNNAATNNAGTNNAANNTTNNTANNTTSPQFEAGNDTAAISTLDPVALCETGTAFFNSVFTDQQAQMMECASTAYLGADVTLETDAELQAACQTTFDACMGEPFVQEVDSGVDCVLVTAGCEATIGLLEDCIDGQIANAFAAVELLDCSTATIDGDPFANEQEPAACVQLDTECPELFGN
jgi:hypothetical protein